jgi:PAS domain S-box-containing protein
MNQEEHYLKTEIYELVRRDPAIFEFLQSGSLDGIWYWDIERQDQEWMSPRFKELFGYRDDEIPNTTAWWQANIFPEDLAVALDNFTKHLTDPSHAYDQIVRYRHRDGGTVWVRCRGLAIRDEQGKPLRLLGAHTDITALKRAEEDLRRQTSELRDARDAAEHTNRAKSIFLANVSHEVRTPLSAVIGTAELLGDTDLTLRQRDHLDTISESAETLLAVINDILDFSKIEAGKFTSEHAPLSLREHLAHVMRSLAPRVRGKNVALVTDVADDVPDALVGDPLMLRQVLSNLLSNGIKFTEQGEVILRVRLQGLTDQDVTLRVEVADTGIGVSPDKQQVIFEEFVQADASTTRRYGGTGLGLAITSRLVVAMGGQIGVESEPGRGSTFHFTARFGLDRAGPAGAPAPPEPVADLRPLRVLLAEDSVANQRIAVGMLEKGRHTVTVVSTGTAAVDACNTQPFDLIVMDLQMPEMDGYEATRRIRQRESDTGAVRTPIVALTARASRGDKDLCLAVGFDGYLTKPFRSRQLREVIATSLAAKERRGTGTETVAADTGLDWDSALQAVDGDHQLLKKVLRGFLDQHSSLVAELRDALQAGDTPVVRRVAHTIGGSLRLFHGARVVTLAQELEDLCLAGSLDQLPAGWRALDAALAAVVTDIRGWVKKS